MRKNAIRFLCVFLLILMLITSVPMSTYAAWWGTPGYEWALANGLTSIKSNKTLNNPVALADLYKAILKYLEYQNVEPKDGIMQNVSGTGFQNQALRDFAEHINTYISKDMLTPQEFRIVKNYVEHFEDTVNKQADLLTRDDLQSYKLYLSLVEYKAATLLEYSDYRNYVFATMGNVKYSGIITYGMKPYYTNISRKEFLILMFSLLSEQSVSEDDILKQFYESGVLKGDENDLMLSKELTYAEMFKFFNRFRTFDFNPEPEETEETETADDEEVVEVK